MAYEWAEEEQENLSAAFSGAVSKSIYPLFYDAVGHALIANLRLDHCLRCFNDPSANLQDAEFLQAAVECIVLPLQEELHQFLGKSSP